MVIFVLPDTSNLISLAREVLYGDAKDWLPLMASEFGVRPDTIRQWHSGRRLVPRHTAEALRASLDRKSIRAEVFQRQIAETLPALRCPKCEAEINVLYKPEGLRAIVCANAHLFNEDPHRRGHFHDASQVQMPDLSPQDQVLLDLDDQAEQARQKWLTASHRNASMFTTAYRDQEGPALDQIEEAHDLERAFRDLHAQRLEAYRQRFASVREVISSGGGMAEGVPLDVIGPADLSPDVELSLRFTRGPDRPGRVVAIEDSGARAVVEVDGKRWWLHKRSTINAGGISRYAWEVGGSEFG